MAAPSFVGWNTRVGPTRWCADVEPCAGCPTLDRPAGGAAARYGRGAPARQNWAQGCPGSHVYRWPPRSASSARTNRDPCSLEGERAASRGLQQHTKNAPRGRGAPPRGAHRCGLPGGLFAGTGLRDELARRRARLLRDAGRRPRPARNSKRDVFGRGVRRAGVVRKTSTKFRPRSTSGRKLDGRRAGRAVVRGAGVDAKDCEVCVEMDSVHMTCVGLEQSMREQVVLTNLLPGTRNLTLTIARGDERMAVSDATTRAAGRWPSWGLQDASSLRGERARARGVSAAAASRRHLGGSVAAASSRWRRGGVAAAASRRRRGGVAAVSPSRQCRRRGSVAAVSPSRRRRGVVAAAAVTLSRSTTDGAVGIPA